MAAEICAVAALSLFLAALSISRGAASEALTTYRLRVAKGGPVPEDPFNVTTFKWTVHELAFFSDLNCTLSISVQQPLASVGKSHIAKAFDGDVATAWTSVCHAGEDSVSQCRASEAQGAWLGVIFSEAVVVHCISLLHSGVEAGLVLESWDPVTSNWAGIQAFGPVRESNVSHPVHLFKASGGSCTSNLVSADNSTRLVPADNSTRQIGFRLPSCAPWSQWRIVPTSGIITWVVHEIEMFRDADCRERSAHSTPILAAGTPSSAARFNDGLLGTSWTAQCVPSASVADSCAAREVWVGLSFSSAETISCVRIFQHHVTSASPGLSKFVLEGWNGTAWFTKTSETQLANDAWSYLPKVSWARQSAWRLINDAAISRAWVVYELEFYRTQDCQEKLERGILISSDGPSYQAQHAINAFDGDPTSAWTSQCTQCGDSSAFLGQHYDLPVLVRCVSLLQGLGAAYRPTAVRLENWDKTDNSTFGWKPSVTFAGLNGGHQQLTPWWRTENSRFAVTNGGFSPHGWRVGELRFFKDTGCSQRMTGVLFGSDGDSADVQQAFDGEQTTFWHADCCVDASELVQCTGCIKNKAWIGIMVLGNEALANCVQMIQLGTFQRGHPPQFISDKVALLRWNGLTWTTIFEWDRMPTSGWVELSVGKQRSALGSNLGCNDIFDWSACNETSWNCSYFRKNGFCENSTYQNVTDCDGVNMRQACRASCCFCATDHPSHCKVEEKVLNEMPAWLIPVAIGCGGPLVFFHVLTFVLWKKRICHHRRCCHRCCSLMDRCAGRAGVVDS